MNDEEQSGKKARRMLWMAVTLAFLLLMAAWGFLISVAMKNAPEVIEVPKVKAH